MGHCLYLLAQSRHVFIRHALHHANGKCPFGKKVVKLRIPILIISLLLLVPSVLGIISTRINYDILSYLPEDIETMKGQDILMEEFDTGAFSICVVEGMANTQSAT
mgnify:CR=1 FL=1